MNPSTSSCHKVLNFEIHLEYSCYSFYASDLFQLMNTPRQGLGGIRLAKQLQLKEIFRTGSVHISELQHPMWINWV